MHERSPCGFVDGQAASGRSENVIAVVNPSTGQKLCEYRAHSDEDVADAVAGAAASFADGRWRRLAPSRQARILNRLAELVVDNGDELAELESRESGKLLAAAQAAEVPFAAECFRYHAGWCSKIEGATRHLNMAPRGAFHAYTLRQPIGVVGLVTPFNGPLVQAAWKIAPALAAGCSVVVKPDEKTPSSTRRLAELAVEAGLPPGVFNVVVGTGAETGAALVRHPLVRKVSFTGSTESGKLVARAALDDLKKVTLELGGKSPVIVLRDARLDEAIKGAADAIFANAGQVCVAGSRLFVEAPVYEQVVAGIVDIARNLTIGRANDSAAQVGPVISESHAGRIVAAVRQGCREGARLLTGGERVAEMAGSFVRPTVLADVTAGMSVVREEIFGPVLVASDTDDVQQSLLQANDSRYGLAASIWTADIGKAHRLAADIEAGLVWVNCHGIPDMSIPFGGFKQSGWGRENGPEGLHEFTELKSVICKL